MIAIAYGKQARCTLLKRGAWHPKIIEDGTCCIYEEGTQGVSASTFADAIAPLDITWQAGSHSIRGLAERLGHIHS